jgi:hypothetical protein
MFRILGVAAPRQGLVVGASGHGLKDFKNGDPSFRWDDVASNQRLVVNTAKEFRSLVVAQPVSAPALADASD